MGKDGDCLRQAARQHGVLSRDQALRLGLSADAIGRRVAAGEWVRVLPSVYRMAGSPKSWLQDLKAATLWAGKGCMISHRAAAALWRLDGFEPGGVELSVGRRVRSEGLKLVVHHPREIKRSEIAAISGIPVTRMVRTLVDLAAVVDPTRLESALECALRRRMVSLEQLDEQVSRRGRQRRWGTKALGALVDARASGMVPTESDLETRLLQALRRGGLPEPVRQFEVVSRGRVIARLDFAYPEHRLAVEADGADPHLRTAKWERDHARRNALAAVGWTSLVATWSRLCQEPDQVAAEVRSALGARIDAQGPRPPRLLCIN